MDGAVNSTETSTVLPASVSGTGAESAVSMRSPATKAMVYPVQLHLPLFRKRHVLVNFCPFAIWVLSGTVTSSIITALSWQEPAVAPSATAVPPPDGVPGVVVVDSSGVEGSGVSVGRDKPGRVGGRVEVTKSGAAGAGVSSETLIQEPRMRLVSRINIQIFFMPR